MIITDISICKAQSSLNIRIKDQEINATWISTKK
jgi:hypothetical protein